MFIKVMETAKSMFMEPDYVRLGSKPMWNRLHVSTEDNRISGHGQTNRRQIFKEQRRSRRAKHAKQEKRKSGYQASVTCMYHTPAGAMAPNNTTQYLINNVYEDQKLDETQPLPQETSGHLYSECLSPKSVSAALDSNYEDILAFQMRDFDELYGLTWKPE